MINAVVVQAQESEDDEEDYYRAFWTLVLPGGGHIVPAPYNSC